MDIDWKDFLKKEFPNGVEFNGSHGRELVIDCIADNCPNPKQHMYVNIKSLDPKHDKCFVCHRCGLSGNHRAFLVAYYKMPYYQIVKQFGDLYGKEEDFFLSTKHFAKSLKNDFDLNEIISKEPECIINLPTCYNALEKQTKFLITRNIPLSIIKKFKIGICDTGFYNGRLIIPVMTGNNKSFIAYNQLGKKSMAIYKELSKLNPENKLFNKKKKKILNPIGSLSAILLFNYNNIKKSNILFIHEGVTDVFRTTLNGYQAVAIFKSHISEYQAILISNLPVKEVCLMLDADVSKNEINKNLLILKEYCEMPVSHVRLENGDPDNISTIKEFKKLISKRSLLPISV